jgi:hypothetical protein
MKDKKNKRGELMVLPKTSYVTRLACTRAGAGSKQGAGRGKEEGGEGGRGEEGGEGGELRNFFWWF